MAISKRLRFEILRRDNHTCRYCGATASDVILTVDHVVPTALGGSDEPSNLVTACAPCNSGKSATNPDAPVVADVAADAVRWSAAIKLAAQAMLEDISRKQVVHEEFHDHWASWTDTPVPLPGEWRSSVDSILSSGLPMPVLIDCVDRAMGNPKIRSGNVFRYMCGIAWNRVSDLQKAAQAAVAPPKDESPGQYNVLDVLDSCVIRQVVEAAGGDKVMSKLAMQCMWEAASAGFRGWKKAIEENDPDGPFEAAEDEASSTAAYYLNAIAERGKGEY